MAARSSKQYFGQLVIGAPGSGKSTYCFHLAKMLKEVFNRNFTMINLDPGNEEMPFKADIDLQKEINVMDVMEMENLGPNGALMFSIEYLEKNIEWLISKISAMENSRYFIFDCPGQIELYTHHKSFQKICDILTNRLGFRLAIVQLADSFYCQQPSLFISVVFTALSAMLQLSLPHINVLSKCDLVEKLGKIDFNLDYYTNVLDLDLLVDKMEEEPFGKKYAKLNKALAEAIEDRNLVGFLPLSIKDPETIYGLIKAVDKAIGYSMSDLEERQVRAKLMSLPPTGPDFDWSLICNLQDKYVVQEEDPSMDQQDSF